MAGAPIEALRSVSLFADLDDGELTQVALLFKLRRFSAGDTVVKEGADGAAFFLIESGEAKVSVHGVERAGLVIPDSFRVSRDGQVLERRPGLKRVAIRSVPDGGTVEEEVDPVDVERLCLDDRRLEELNRLARRCEEIYGPDRDIEWAVAGGQVYLLQCRAVTRVGR